MIHEVDDALHGLFSEGILRTSGTDVVFDPPTREWAVRRTGPAVDLFLYDIREDMGRRQTGRIEHSDTDGTLAALREPLRWYRLSYLVTAWTVRPQDEHRLLSAVLAGLIGERVLPPTRLSGSLAELGVPIRLDVALPPTESRALTELWSALGGELKPSIDLMVTAPLRPAGAVPAPPVREPLEVHLLDRGEDPGPRRPAARSRRVRGVPGKHGEGPIRP